MAKRGDQRRNPDDDERAVDRAGQQPDGHGGGAAQRDRIALLPHEAERDAGQGDDRADREVDAAGENDRRHRGRERPISPQGRHMSSTADGRLACEDTSHTASSNSPPGSR